MLSKIFSLIILWSIVSSSFQLPVLKDKLSRTRDDNYESWNFDEMDNDQKENDFSLNNNQPSNEYQDDFDFVNNEPEMDETQFESQNTEKLVDQKQDELSTAESTTRPYFVGTFETEILYPSTNAYTTTLKLMSNEEFVDIDQNDDDEENLFF